MKKTVLLVVVLLLAAVLGGLLWWLGQGTQTRVSDAPIAVAGADSADEALLDGETREAGERVARAADVQAPPVVEAQASRRGAFELRVVEKATGRAVPNASVRWLAVHDAVRVQLGLWRVAGALVDEVARNGQHVEADDEGRVYLDRVEGTVVIIAESDGQFGWNAISRRSVSPDFVELVPDRTLRVEVVDSRAFPCAGVPVALRSRSGFDLDDVVRAVTREPDGVAEIPHAGMHLDAISFAQTSIAIAAALEPPVEIPIDEGALPGDTVRLVLPPTGAVEVWLRRKDGRVYTDPVEVGLQCLRAGALDPRKLARDRTRSSLRVTSVGGRAFFPYVSLDCTVEATVMRPGRETQCVVQGLGPREAGERATLLLDVDADPLVPTVEARAVDRERQPIANARLAVRTFAGTPPVPTRFTYVRTDSDGRFQLGIHDEHFEEGPIRLLVCETTGDQSIVRGAEVPLPKELKIEVVPIGDVVLERGTRIASGRVVDTAGAPIANAEVSLLAREVSYGIFADWLRDSTDESGRFEIHGWLEAARLNLRASRSGYGARVVAIELGTSGLDIALHAAGSIAGSVLFADGFPFHEIQVHCSREAVNSGSGAWYQVRADGQFLVPELDPGTHRVQLRVRGEPEVLVDAGGIVVRAGEVSADPRLQGVDLRARLHRFELRVRAHDGRALSEIETHWRPSESQEALRYGFSHNGRETFVSTKERIDVTVTADGFRTAHITGLTGSRDVVLQPAIEIELVLKGATPPPAPFALVPILVAEDESEAEAGWGEMPFNELGTARRRIPAPGKYRVQFGIQTGELFRGETWIELALEPTIEVRDVSDVQRFEIRLDPKDLESALPKAPAPK